MLLQNTCRRRRTLNQTIAILDSLQAEGEMHDAEIHNTVANILSTPPTAADNQATSNRALALRLENLHFYPLAAWSYFWKLTVCEWSITLGLQTDVFLPDELAQTYALLEYLAQTREEHLGHVDNFAQRRMQRLARAGDRSGVTTVIDNRAFLNVLKTQAKATRFLAQALKDVRPLSPPLQVYPS